MIMGYVMYNLISPFGIPHRFHKFSSSWALGRFWVCNNFSTRRTSQRKIFIKRHFYSINFILMGSSCRNRTINVIYEILSPTPCKHTPLFFTETTRQWFILWSLMGSTPHPREVQITHWQWGWVAKYDSNCPHIIYTISTATNPTMRF